MKGSNFANESDRLVVPLEFYYSLNASENVTTADFVLKDADSVVVAKYQASQVDPIRKVFISVSEKLVQTIPESTSSGRLLYTLEVNGDNGYKETLKLIFYKGKEKISDTWGLIQINLKRTNSNFDLLDSAGLLLTRRLPEGTYNPVHPVFEIDVRSRISFWRYINEEKKDFQQNLHADQLVLRGGKLVSKKPRALSFTPVFFQKADNTPYYLPNPKPDEMLRPEEDKVYSDVYVRESKDLFPLGP
jgi:hypothetical protein